ncbi:hypothetical protein AB7W76_21780 [Providencia rettgeri]
MKKMLIALSLLLAGCAKVSDYQNKCEIQNEKLSQVATCLNNSVSSDSRMANSPQVKMYILAAKYLGEKVDAGEITDTQARLELQNFYIALQNQEAYNSAMQGQAIQQGLLNYQTLQTMQAIQNKANRPDIYYPPVQQHGNVSTNCYKLGDNVHCNSSY